VLGLLSRIGAFAGFVTLRDWVGDVTLVLTAAQAHELAVAIEAGRPLMLSTALGGAAQFTLQPDPVPRLSLVYQPASGELAREIFSVLDTPAHRWLLGKTLRTRHHAGWQSLHVDGHQLWTGTALLTFDATLNQLGTVAAAPHDERHWVPGVVWGEHQPAAVSREPDWVTVLRCREFGTVRDLHLTWGDLHVLHHGSSRTLVLNDTVFRQVTEADPLIGTRH
jgi:hypothetical protein